MSRANRATVVPSSEKRFKQDCKRFKQERKLEQAFEDSGVISRAKQLKNLKHRQRTHIRSARYNIKHGLYLELLRDAGWLIQVQTLIEQLEKSQS